MTPKRKTRTREKNRGIQRLLAERAAEADDEAWGRVACLNHEGDWRNECPNCIVGQPISE